MRGSSRGIRSRGRSLVPYSLLPYSLSSQLLWVPVHAVFSTSDPMRLAQSSADYLRSLQEHQICKETILLKDLPENSSTSCAATRQDGIACALAVDVCGGTSTDQAVLLPAPRC